MSTPTQKRTGPFFLPRSHQEHKESFAGKFIKIFALLLSQFVILHFQAGFGQQHLQINRLVPDVEYMRKADRTYIFSRAQFIYSPGRTDYLHRWADRPLFINSVLDANKDRNALMSQSAYSQMQKTVLSYGLDGFAFFPQTSRRSEFYGYTLANSEKGFLLLNELTGEAISKADVLENALNNPQSFRINGKVVITSYNADREDLSKWKTELQLLNNHYQNKFLFLPSISNFGGKPMNYWQKKYNTNSLTANDIVTIKSYLRNWLSVTDGLYFSNVSSLIDDDRNFDAEFYRNFVIRLMKSVLAEPASKNKLLGLSACVGHENVTRFGYTLSSEGTKTLRESMEAALQAKPDLINIPEWDEQNENTSLRPTVYNGLSSMRIMRYYTAVNRGEQLTALPGDRTDIPDLTVSYRKVLTLGEKLEIELLNVPTSANNSTYSAKLVLKDLAGNTVYASEEKQFQGGRLEAEDILLPSEQFSRDRALIPNIELRVDQQIIPVTDGLQYIGLQPTWNWDYKWVKQPIRDLLPVSQTDLQIDTDPLPRTFRKITGSIDAKKPIAQAELLDNNDVVYSYSNDESWHGSEEQVVISLTLQSFGGMDKGLNLSGSISLENAKGKWNISKDISYAPKVTGQVLSFNKARSSIWKQQVLLAVPRAEVDKASLSIQMPGIYQGNISLKDIMEKEIIGLPGPDGFNLVISNYLRQYRIPENANQKQIQFSTLVVPDLVSSLYHLQLIGIDGNLYRGKPIAATAASGESTPVTVFSDTKKAPVSVSVDKNAVPDILYEFNPSHGSILMAKAGRPFWGILGGYFAQATERGGGNAGDDIPFISGKGYPSNTDKTAPDWVKLNDGSYALQFDGKGTFVSLPQGVIPRRAAYTIEMDINPENGQGKQIIISHRSFYPGSLTVYLEDGTLKAAFNGENTNRSNLNTGLTLSSGQWSHLTIRYDQKDLIISVNGKNGKAFSIPGPGMYETATVVGGYGDQWFKGRISSLRIAQGN